MKKYLQPDKEITFCRVDKKGSGALPAQNKIVYGQRNQLKYRLSLFRDLNKRFGTSCFVRALKGGLISESFSI